MSDTTVLVILLLVFIVGSVWAYLDDGKHDEDEYDF